MPLAQCLWCLRSRLVELRTWRSPKTGAQLCGEVCGHCYFGGSFDDCRTCRARQDRADNAAVQHGVRPLGRQEALEIFARSVGKGQKRRE